MAAIPLVISEMLVNSARVFGRFRIDFYFLQYIKNQKHDCFGHRKSAWFGHKSKTSMNSIMVLVFMIGKVEMSGSVSYDEGSTTYTASVAAEDTLDSPVTVTGDGCTVMFDGNNFSSKHLRRIRRNSVSELQSPATGGGKLTNYILEAAESSVDRWDGKIKSTNSLIFLDLGQFCQFGAKVIKVIKDGTVAWTPYGPNNIQQKHAVVEIGRCLAYSHSGTGQARASAQGDGRIQGGVGITMTVTVAQVGGSPTIVTVCHFAGGDVVSKFKTEYPDKSVRAGIANTIVG